MAQCRTRFRCFSAKRGHAAAASRGRRGSRDMPRPPAASTSANGPSIVGASVRGRGRNREPRPASAPVANSSRCGRRAHKNPTASVDSERWRGWRRGHGVLPVPATASEAHASPAVAVRCRFHSDGVRGAYVLAASLPNRRFVRRTPPPHGVSRRAESSHVLDRRFRRGAHNAAPGGVWRNTSVRQAYQVGEVQWVRWVRLDRAVREVLTCRMVQKATPTASMGE